MDVLVVEWEVGGVRDDKLCVCRGGVVWGVWVVEGWGGGGGGGRKGRGRERDREREEGEREGERRGERERVKDIDWCRDDQLVFLFHCQAEI